MATDRYLDREYGDAGNQGSKFFAFLLPSHT